MAKAANTAHKAVTEDKPQITGQEPGNAQNLGEITADPAPQQEQQDARSEALANGETNEVEPGKVYEYEQYRVRAIAKTERDAETGLQVTVYDFEKLSNKPERVTKIEARQADELNSQSQNSGLRYYRKGK